MKPLSSILPSVSFAGLLAITLIGGLGCSAKAKLERHVKRADAFYEKGQMEAAHLEYLNAFRLNQNDPHVAARLGESFLANGDAQRAFQLLSHARDLQPTNNAVRVKVASMYLLGGDPKRARAEAEEVLKAEPLNSDALVLLANSAANSSEVVELRRRLEGLSAKNPQNAGVQMALGVLAQRSGDLVTAQARFAEAARLDPKAQKAHFALANVCFAQGKTNLAEQHFKAASDLAPAKSVERLGISEFYFKTGRPDLAKGMLEEALNKAPDFSGAWTMLTQIAFAQRDTNAAANYISKALEWDPGNRDALLNRARLKLAVRDFAAASAELQQLAEKFPRDSQVQHQLALAFFGSDDHSKALAALDKAISLNTNNFDSILLRSQVQLSRGDHNSAIPELTRLAQVAPGVPQPQYLLAQAYLQRRSIGEALNVYSNIAKRFPSDPQPFQMIGGVHRSLTNIAAARASYEAALKINPDFLPAIDDLIELDIVSIRHADAMARVQGYIEKYPDKPMPRLLQAKVLFAQEKNVEAEAAVQKAIELDPEFYAAHRALADFYIRTDQLDSAIGKLESMVVKNSKDVASLLQVGMLYESKGDYAKARSSYEALLKVNPSSIPALNNLAYVLSEHMNDLEIAYQHARKARDLDPYNPFVADTFGWILHRRGEYQPALAALQQAADRLQNQPEVRYHLGMTHYMLGSIDSAAAALTAAVTSPTNFIGKGFASNALAILKIDSSRPAPNSLELLTKAVEINPNDALAWTKLAQLHESKQDWANARESYQKALRVNPRSGLVLSRLAALHSGPLNDPAKALEIAKQAWSYTQTPEIAAAIGPIGYRSGDLRWAFGVLLEAQRAQPPHPEAAYFLGLTAFNLGRLPQSIESFQAAANAATLPQKMSQLAQSGAHLASFLSGNASADVAQAALTQSAALDPSFPPAAAASAVLAERKGDFSAARRGYEALIKAQPSMIVAQRQLALLLGERLGDDAKALEIYSAIRSDFPNDPALSALAGKIAYRRGDHAEAVRNLRAAALQPGADPELLYYLGLSQFHLKETGAKATLTRAVNEVPQGKLVADARKALAELEKK